MVYGRVVIGLIVVLALIASIVAAERRGRLRSALAVVLIALAAGWSAAAFAVRADYRDADGFVDCWPACSTLQDAVGATLFYGPPTAMLVLATATLLVVLRRTRSGRR